MTDSDAHEMLSAWRWDGPVELFPVSSGLINRSFTVLVDQRAAAVLQRLNTEIVPAAVNADIAMVTARLVEREVPTPLLIPTISGELWTEDRTGGVWRCLTHVGDRTVTRFSSPDEAASAGRLVARFHGAVADLDGELSSPRQHAQDTEVHLANLRAALDKHSEHTLNEKVYPLAEAVEAAWREWSGPTALPQRLIHGDLKISNIRFRGAEALALIDLDTFAISTLEVELGDAMRSWCNAAGENRARADFDLEVFAAAMGGFGGALEPGLVSDDEWDAVIPGLERITVNLCARFAADALNESYFGWDPKFGSRGEHNLLRAKGQLSLLRAVQNQRSQVEKALRAAQTR